MVNFVFWHDVNSFGEIRKNNSWLTLGVWSTSTTDARAQTEVLPTCELGTPGRFQEVYPQPDRDVVRPNPDYTCSQTLLITMLNFEFENVVV